MKFTKMHGAGNDFVVIDLSDETSMSSEMLAWIANRNIGVGCDLILGLRPSRAEHVVAAFDIWTPVGEKSMQCGNGLRCIAAWAVRNRLTTASKFAIESPSGVHDVEVLKDGFRVEMTVPSASIDLDLVAAEEVIRANWETAGVHIYGVHKVDVGNPHLLIEVSDVLNSPVKRIGSLLQGLSLAPMGLNVGFVQVTSAHEATLRVYEFGAGETLSCASGACAMVAALSASGRIGADVRVSQRGGQILVDRPQPFGPIYQSGPALLSFEGVFDHVAF